jgi:hypothetical protein
MESNPMLISMMLGLAILFLSEVVLILYFLWSSDSKTANALAAQAAIAGCTLSALTIILFFTGAC